MHRGHVQTYTNVPWPAKESTRIFASESKDGRSNPSYTTQGPQLTTKHSGARNRVIKRLASHSHASAYVVPAVLALQCERHGT